MQVGLLLGDPMDGRLGSCQTTQRVERGGLHAVGSAGLFDRCAKRGRGPLDPAGHLDDDARPARVAAGLVANVDAHLVAEPQRLDSRVEDGALGPRVEERAERHVSRDAGEAIEVRDCHARVLLMCAAAASMGSMLGGCLATRTETPSTRGSCTTRSTIARASDSRSCIDGPSITSLAAARTFV